MSEPRDRLDEAIYAAVDGLAEPEPSPGFDAAMYAKLDALDAPAEAKQSAWSRILAAFTGPRIGFALAAAAAITFAVLVYRPAEPPGPALFAQSPDTLEIVEDLELYRDFELIDHLDVLEDLDVIEGMDDAG